MRTRCDVEWTVNVLMYIGMAKAGSFDPQQHFSRAGMRIRKVLVTQIFSSVINECFHGLDSGYQPTIDRRGGSLHPTFYDHSGGKLWPQNSRIKSRKAKSIATRLPAVKTLLVRRAFVMDGPQPTIA